jgi:hypothetical protein
MVSWLHSSPLAKPWLATLLALGLAAPQDPRPAPTRDGETSAFLDRIEAAWQTRDVSAWLELWAFASPDDRAEEESLVRQAFASDEVVFSFVRRPEPRPGATSLEAEAQVFMAREPKASVRFFALAAERRASGWVLTHRHELPQMDGLVHLALGPEAFRVRDFELRFSDFSLRLEDGTLFTTPDTVGPTLLLFLGRARVRFAPGPPAEKEQLGQFYGRPTIDRQVDWVFVRAHPSDFLRAKGERVFEPDPSAGSRRRQAQKLFEARASRSFLVDAPLPRSPWWLMPGLGDAVVDFPWGRKNVLTFALTAGEPEDVNLFDRDRRLQICTYASTGERVSYSEDDDRVIDVLEHDLMVRFEPERFELSAVHRMRVRLVAPAATLRLRLDEDLRVSSVRSGEGTNLLFFRVRGQNTLVVSLGPLGSREAPFTIVTQYAGRHDPAPVDDELLQLGRATGQDALEDVFVDPAPVVYANRTAWYPHPPNEDFAVARLGFDTPAGWMAVTGGELVDTRTEQGRTRAEFRLPQPGKYVTAVVGRLTELGLRQEGQQAVRGYATPRTKAETLDEMPRLQDMLAFYARLFGDPPYPVLNLVVAEAPTPGGHSPPGMLYVQVRPPLLRSRPLPQDPANFSDIPGFFLAHEAAHQWWGQGLAPGNYRERWLSEAWAQYAAALWVRERHGERSFQSMMDRMASWAMRHDSAGPIHLGQRLGHLKAEPRFFRSVVYNKGAWVLHMLRGIVGDAAFFGAARSFLERHRYDKAGTEQLREALEASSGRALGPYFDRWVYETGLPELAWRTSSTPVEGRYRTTIELEATGLPGVLPLQLSVATASGQQTIAVQVPPGRSTHTIDSDEPPRRVSLNDDRGLLARVVRSSGPAQR